jgi:hypothetical protein
MGTGAGSEHIHLSDHGAVVDVECAHGTDAWMFVSAGPDDVRAPCARLVERAVEEARRHRVRRIDTALDISAPSTGGLLQALRGHVGREITSVSMHRAGASAMVTIVLSPPAPPLDRGPLPRQARPGVRRLPGHGARSVARARAGGHGRT